MSDSRPPRHEPRRRSGLGLLLPLLLAGLLLYWVMTSNNAKSDTHMRGQTLQIFPFDTPRGPAIARRVMDIPTDRTDVYVFTNGTVAPAAATGNPTAEPSKQLLEMSRTKEPFDTTGASDPARPWPGTAQVSAAAGPLGCTLVDDQDLLIFYVANADPNTGAPTRAVGYRYPQLTNNSIAERVFVDPDILPEVFVAAPPALLAASKPTDAGTAATTDAAADLATPTTPPAPAATDDPLPPAPTVTATTDSAQPIVRGPTASSANQNTTKPDTTGACVWAFGRSISTLPDQRNRLCAIEIQGAQARVRTVSTSQVQISAASFLLTAVPMDDAVHLFWRVVPDNGLPARVINHATYDGETFTLLPAIQDAPTGFFTSSRRGDQILLCVLKPIDPVDPKPENRFRGNYELQHALLDCTPVKAPVTPAPPVLAWTPAAGLGTIESKFDLEPVTRLDGRITQLMLRGSPHGLDEIALVTIPATLESPWPHRDFINSTPQLIPDADKIVVFLMIGMLGLFGAIMLVAWLRPWRWFGRPPSR